MTRLKSLDTTSCIWILCIMTLRRRYKCDAYHIFAQWSGWTDRHVERSDGLNRGAWTMPRLSALQTLSCPQPGGCRGCLWFLVALSSSLTIWVSTKWCIKLWQHHREAEIVKRVPRNLEHKIKFPYSWVVSVSSLRIWLLRKLKFGLYIWSSMTHSKWHIRAFQVSVKLSSSRRAIFIFIFKADGNKTL